MKNVKDLIIKELKAKGIDFKKDYFELSHSQIYELGQYGKQIGFKTKNKTRPYGYSFYQSLKRYLKNK